MTPNTTTTPAPGGAVTARHGRQLSTADVAERLGVKPATVSAYRHHGRMPAPDGRLGKTVWWWEDTITAWQAERPGQGWRKGQDGPRS